MRLNAVRRISTIALALGEERTRAELIPFLKGRFRSYYFKFFVFGPNFQIHLKRRMKFYRLCRRRYALPMLLKLIYLRWHLLAPTSYL